MRKMASSARFLSRGDRKEVLTVLVLAGGREERGMVSGRARRNPGSREKKSTPDAEFARGCEILTKSARRIESDSGLDALGKDVMRAPTLFSRARKA